MPDGSNQKPLVEHLNDRSHRRADPAAWTAGSDRGMVATAHYLATAAGVEMLTAGGDAIDAAVAASLALGVCEPAGSGLGGMAMMMVYRQETGETIALPGPCRAPEQATPEAVRKGKRYRGYRAVAVPAAPAVLEAAQARFGRLPLDRLFEPAIRYSEDGFTLTPNQHSLLRRYRGSLRRGSAGTLFLADRELLRAGTVVRQPLLAKTLERLAREGLRDFYEGKTARDVARDMEEFGGFIRESDLRNASGPVPVPPLSTRFGAVEVHTMPPPGGGLALILMLNLFDEARLPAFDADSPEGALFLTRLIQRARRERLRQRLTIGAESPGEGGAKLLDRAFALERVERILDKTPGDGETSHIVVADRWGNLVSLTQSLERSFGAAEISPRLGFLYNGFLRAFKIRNRRHPHYLTPGAPARSNASPALMVKNGVGWGAIGNTGSERLASGIFQALVRLRTQTPFEAVHAPRLHCTPDGVVLYEDRFSREVLDALSGHGFTLERLDPYAFKSGGMNLIVRYQEAVYGVTDPRRDGMASGFDNPSH